MLGTPNFAMFYSYHNLQGSQTMVVFIFSPAMFYSYHNLQGSQTKYIIVIQTTKFYSYHNLQGSQTSNSYLRTYPSGKWYKL